MITPLIVHNYYKQPGGEDQVFAVEESLLQRKGHRVIRYTVHNRFIEQIGKLSLFRKTLWNQLSYQEIVRIIREEKPDVVHFHNTFPLISPAAYYAARRCGVAVVQTLHNYRLLCPEARFFRNGTVCEVCLKKQFPWPAILYGCYQSSRPNSAAVALMLYLHRHLKTWRTKVDRYILLTEFARWKFCEAGFAPETMAVKPNFLVDDPGTGRDEGGYVLFVGRLSPEKGIDTLLEAWSLQKKKSSRLKIVGGGPLVHHVVKQIQSLDSVDYLGEKTHVEVLELMKKARAIVVPSLWYEGFPMTVVEAYATGLPVIAAKIGSLIELVHHGETGLHFRPGDPAQLAAQLEHLHAQPQHALRMRAAARREYENKYSADTNYTLLVDIYNNAIEHAKNTWNRQR